MKTKLTLSLEAKLIAVAKEEAASRGVSLSQMVENYFAAWLHQRGKTAPLGPRTTALYGSLNAKADKKDYHRYLEEKYQ